MGTIVGDDGGSQSHRCRSGCAVDHRQGMRIDQLLLDRPRGGRQWMLAPTDLNGQNPREDLRPDIVSNSWSGAAGDTFYRQIVQNWVAAGIFPVFATATPGRRAARWRRPVTTQRVTVSVPTMRRT